jgi:hypothetical protein
MTPEQLQQFNEMKRELDSLKSAILISPDVETAFVERLKVGNIANAVDGTGTTTASTQNKNLSGDPETISIPAQPSGALVVTYKGTIYNLLYK